MRLKAILLTLLTILTVINYTMVSYGADFSEEYDFENTIFIDYETSKVSINGKIVDFKKVYSTPVIIKNGRAFVPVRFLAEEMGADVLWDGEEFLATVILNGSTAKFYIRTKLIEVDGNKIESDVNVENINGRIFIPLRFFAENIMKKAIYYYNSMAAIVDKEEIASLEKENYVFYEMQSKIRNYSDRPLFLISENDLYGFIYSNGEIAIEPKFRYAENFKEGLALARGDNGKYGYINEKGEWEIEPQFDFVQHSFNQGISTVYKSGEKYSININGERLGLSPYLVYGEGIAMTEIDGCWTLVYKDGSTVKCEGYQPLIYFSEGRARIEGENGKYGYIDGDGNIVVEPKYERSENFNEGLAVVKFSEENDSWGYINRNGEVVIEPKFEWAAYFHEGLAAVQYKGKYGYIDKSGNFVIEPQFDLALDFSEGYAKVFIDGKEVFINRKGEVVIDMEMTSADYFHNGLSYVCSREQGKTGYIDKNGNWVWYRKFEESDLGLY